MPFLGKQPTAGFASIVKDDLTPNGSTTVFTLSKQVANANDIAVFVGNVRQEPTDAYSVSGTTLTMTAAPASGVNFYVLHIAGTVESSVVPADNTISTAKIQADAITTAKIASSAVTDAKIAGMSSSKLTGALPAIDGSALTGVSAGLLTTACAFSAYRSTTQSFGTATQTDLTFNTERWDVGNDYDNSTSRFTVPVNGIYLFNLRMRRDGEYSGTDMAEFHVNNSQVHRIMEEKNLNNSYSYPLTFEVSWVWSLAAGDVCNLEFWTNASSSVITGYADAKYANNWSGTLIQET